MSIFLMFGKYSSEAMKDISSDRTERAREVIRKIDGEDKIMFTHIGIHRNYLTAVLLDHFTGFICPIGADVLHRLR